MAVIFLWSLLSMHRFKKSKRSFWSWLDQPIDSESILPGHIGLYQHSLAKPWSCHTPLIAFDEVASLTTFTCNWVSKAPGWFSLTSLSSVPLPPCSTMSLQSSPPLRHSLQSPLASLCTRHMNQIKDDKTCIQGKALGVDSIFENRPFVQMVVASSKQRFDKFNYVLQIAVNHLIFLF